MFQVLLALLGVGVVGFVESGSEVVHFGKGPLRPRPLWGIIIQELDYG